MVINAFLHEAIDEFEYQHPRPESETTLHSLLSGLAEKDSQLAESIEEAFSAAVGDALERGFILAVQICEKPSMLLLKSS